MSKRSVIEWSVIIGIILVLMLTGWHRPVIVYMQRALIYTGLLAPSTEKPGVVDHSGVYDLTLRDEYGNLISLSDMRGQVIFINLWATWCPPCRAEMPGINNLYQKVQNDKLSYVILTTEQDFGKARDYKAKEGFDFPIYQLAGSLPPIYRDRSIPRSYVISQEGKLIFEHSGLADYDSRKFREFLGTALAGTNEQ